MPAVHDEEMEGNILVDYGFLGLRSKILTVPLS